MKNTLCRFIPGLVLLFAAGPLAATQEAQSLPTIRYEIRFMDLHAAEVLAWDQCVQKEKCRVATASLPGDSTRKGYLDVGAEAAVQEKVARALAKEDRSPGTQRFQILLLAGTTKPGASGPEIPANAEKALADLKQFLPFKSYRLVDAAWLSGTEGQSTRGRLAGSGGVAYDVTLRFRATGDREAPSLFMDLFQLGQEEVLQTKDGPHYDVRQLIQTTFSLKEGETIVVGTSKADGTDEAVVTLLTAVPAQ
jgi:hypothetical protein